MKNIFLIENHPCTNPEISALVLAADIESPLEHIEDVERELTESNIKGLVVFDLLVSHGNKNNRFFSGFFNGDKFSDRMFKSELSSYLIFSELSAPHLKNHVHDINDVLLSKAMKFAIKKGIPL